MPELLTCASRGNASVFAVRRALQRGFSSLTRAAIPDLLAALNLSRFRELSAIGSNWARRRQNLS